MAGERICDVCGKGFTGAACPECLAASKVSLAPSLPFAGSVLLLFVLIGLSATRIAVVAYKAKISAISSQWQREGQNALSESHADEAVDDFENALVYNRDDRDLHLQLANALAKAGRFEESRQHLLSLWEQKPGDANVNLQLARLEARGGNLSRASGFYEGAIYGVWPAGSNPYEERAAVRLEFAKLLISKHQNDEALAQLAAVASETPRISEQHKIIGDLLLEANAPRQAKEEYSKPRNGGRTMAGAQLLDMATAEFRMNDFEEAKRYAVLAARDQSPPAGAAELATRTAAIVAADPYSKGVGELERALRIIRDVETADQRMSRCYPSYVLGPGTREAVQQQSSGANAPTGTLSAQEQSQVANFSNWMAQLKPRMVASKLRHEDDVQENAMRFVFQAEILASKNCQVTPTAQDAALITLAKARWSNE